MLGITDFNRMDYMLEMRCDLLGETWINISLNGEPPAMYVQPSFADALTVPILSSNRQTVSNLASDMDTFLSSTISNDVHTVAQNQYLI